MKKLFRKIGDLWRKLTGKAKKIIQDNIEPAIKVVNILKDAVENPALNMIVQLTPFGWDDVAFKTAKSILPKVLIEMNLLQTSVGASTNSEMIRQIIEQIRTYTKSDRAQFYTDLAAKLAVMLSDGKLSVDEAAELVKFVYEEKFKTK